MVTDTTASDTVIATPVRYFADFVALAAGLRPPDDEGKMPVGALNHLVSHCRDLCAPMTALPGGGQIFKMHVLASGTLGHDVFTGVISAVGAVLSIPPEWGFSMRDWIKMLDGILPQKIGDNGCPEDCSCDLQSGGWKLLGLTCKPFTELDMLQARIAAQAEPFLRESQYGFRAQRGTRHPLFAVCT